jgi:adenylosuccinate lyase
MLEPVLATADTAAVPDLKDTTIPDVLADRYASRAMRDLWSPRGKILLEREFWIAVLRAQRALGLAVPSEAFDAYERVQANVDLESIRQRERQTRHDVKARIDEFCALAGHEHITKGSPVEI